MVDTPLTLTVVSHTHWDREWYRPFQEFRLRLVRLIDDLLDILDTDPAYESFLLDGQTIILEDYLDIRPEREADLRRHIAAGRLIIGPWHILPDEFLVGPESTVRNLMLGARLCADFGMRMPVGYTPDPFGHVSQLPQILAGVGIDVAMFRRGLSEEPAELWWEAPDGTRAFTIYLREGYDNLQWAPTDPDAFVAVVERQIARLGPHSRSGHLLLLNGTDHQPPQREIPALLRTANQKLAGRAVLRQGTLPEFAQAARAALGAGDDLPVVRGELRDPRRHHLLPGVLSTRMWIKQRNHAVETALTRYAEPLSAITLALGGPDRRGELWRAWRHLIENHPHDSICGCSIDQVHEEMRTRFDWAAQIAGRVADEGLCRLGAQIDPAALAELPASPPPDPPDAAVTVVPSSYVVTVFNPTAGARTEAVTVETPWRPPDQHPALTDADGAPVACQWTDERDPLLDRRELDADAIDALIDALAVGAYRARLIRDVRLWFDGDALRAEIVLTESHPCPKNALMALAAQLRERIARAPFTRGTVTTYFAVRRTLRFVAADVPGVGYRAYRLHSAGGGTLSPSAQSAEGRTLENDWLRVEADPADGTLTITDKVTGCRYAGLNRLQDGGDRGDEYNYCPPETDQLVTAPDAPPTITRIDDGPFGQRLAIEARYRLPARLTDDRSARSAGTVPLPVRTEVTLAPDARRVDLRVTLDNRAEDHRLRALFPTGIAARQAIVDGHFDRLLRDTALPADTAGWVEQPQPTNAQRAFCAVANSDGTGLMLAVRGLPEYELIPEADNATLALTLLRCVGWLSRDDFPCRTGQAGPELATPGAQCPGPATFAYSLIPFGSFALDEAAQQAYAFEAPLQAALSVPGGGSLPPCAALLTLEPAALVLTAIKPAEGGEGLVVRFYNSSADAVKGAATFGLPVRAVTPVNLLEEPLDVPRPVDAAGRIAVTVPGKRIVSWHVTFDPAEAE